MNIHIWCFLFSSFSQIPTSAYRPLFQNSAISSSGKIRFFNWIRIETEEDEAQWDIFSEKARPEIGGGAVDEFKKNVKKVAY